MVIVKHPQEPGDFELPIMVQTSAPKAIAGHRVAEMYDAGNKMWTKRDLEDIERQIEQSATLEKFTFPCIDGKQIQQENAFFGVEKSIWKPFLVYDDYWSLVTGESVKPPEALSCPYSINWRTRAASDFVGNVEDWEKLFQKKRHLWNQSITRQSLALKIKRLLHANPMVNKVICFGLGDIARRPAHEKSEKEDLRIVLKSEAAYVHRPMMQHAAALSIAEEICHYRGGHKIRLLAQDPGYTDDTKNLLRDHGFKIVGEFGAGGFAEVDDESFVFSAFVSLPVKQIIADIARPAGFITLGHSKPPIDNNGNHFRDAETPRTRRMWQQYETEDFPISSVEVEDMQGLVGLKFIHKTGTTSCSPVQSHKREP